MLKGVEHSKPIVDCHCILLGICQVLQLLEMKHSVVTSWRLSGYDMKLECSNNKPVISCKELSTPKNPAVLKDPPMSIDKDMVNLLRYPSGIAIPNPAVQRWSLIPGTHNSQPSRSCKIQKERAVVISGT